MSEAADKVENFERAFSSGTGGCRRRCHCGKTYYDGYGSYTWEEGEKAQLEKDGAICLDHTVGDINFEGNEYVDASTCWHARAIKIMEWLDAHAHAAAEYLSLEKQRKFDEAERSPTVREPKEKM